MIKEVMQKQALNKTHQIKGSESPATSEMKFFTTNINRSKPLIIVEKIHLTEREFLKVSFKKVFQNL